jgi:polysaccharide pyruvyl transferase WcaK-like protein
MYFAHWETDLPIARAIEEHIGDPERVRILRPETTLAEVVGAIGSLDAFVGTPMHSTLFSTSQYVPTLALYYELKGLEYFAQIGMQRWALPLDSLHEPGGRERLAASIEQLWVERQEIRRQLEDCIPRWAARAHSNLRHLEAVLATPAGA